MAKQDDSGSVPPPGFQGAPKPDAAPTPQATAPPAGWYADPQGAAGNRWWDGVAWTAHQQRVPLAAKPVELALSAPVPRLTLSTKSALCGLAAILGLVGLFTPMSTPAAGGPPLGGNSLIAHGDWWLLVASIAAGLIALGLSRRPQSDAVVLTVASVLFLLGGITGAVDATKLYIDGGPDYWEGTPAIGIYLTIAAGVITLLASVGMFWVQIGERIQSEV